MRQKDTGQADKAAGLQQGLVSITRNTKTHIMPGLMPSDATLSGALSTGGSMMEMGLQALQNRRQQKFAVKMYDRQRQDALADWNMQNSYNAPAAQMARLKAAGLNPNLVYGHGADAQSTSPVRSSTAQSWNQIPLRGSSGDFMGSMYDLRLHQAQIDNLEQQKTTGAQMAANIAARTAGQFLENYNKGVKGQNLELDAMAKAIKNQFLPSLLQTSLSAAQANVSKTQVQTQYITDENIRKTLALGLNMQTTAERLILMEAQRKATLSQIPVNQARVDQIKASANYLKTQKAVIDYDDRMQKQGIPRTSPWYIKGLHDILDGFDFPDPRDHGAEVNPPGKGHGAHGEW